MLMCLCNSYRYNVKLCWCVYAIVTDITSNHVDVSIKVITKLPNSEQSYKGKVKTHNYINRQNQSTTGKLWKRNDPDLETWFKVISVAIV
jgi:hypothetical protein